MNQTMLLALAAGAAVFAVAMVALLGSLSREQRVARRLRAIQPVTQGAAVAADSGGVAIGRVTGMGMSIIKGGLLSRSTVEGLEQTLRAAGFRGERALGLFIGAKIVLLIAMPVVFGLFCVLLNFDQTETLFGLLIGAAVGLLMPDFIAGRLRARYIAQLEKGLPDGLDLLVICAEAGLSLQPAMERVADEIGVVHAPVAAEFKLTLYELRVLTDRREALTRMAKRTKVEPLQRLAQSLIQSLQYGTPMSQALRMLSGELRQEQLTRFEARAARLPVLLTLPMVLFILPTLFLVVGGPAAIQVMRVW